MKDIHTLWHLATLTLIYDLAHTNSANTTMQMSCESKIGNIYSNTFLIQSFSNYSSNTNHKGVSNPRHAYTNIAMLAITIKIDSKPTRCSTI